MKRSKVKTRRKIRVSAKVIDTQPFVGTYRLGTTNVEVFGNTKSYGGEFYCVPDGKSLPRMKIGMGYNHWWEVMAVAQHEAFEYVAAQMELRFAPCGTAFRASDTYRFVMNHEQFSRVCEEVGYFLSKVLPDLNRVWKSASKK